MKGALIFVLFSMLQVVRPDFGLINLLYWKADANLDHIITKAELENIWHGFDHNKDKHVTKEEFVPLWREVTGHSEEMAIAYFLLADETDTGRIEQADLDLMFILFDKNKDGHVSPEEFSLTWQKIILDVPFAVMFEHGDANNDNNLTSQEFTNAFLYLDANHDHQLTKVEFIEQWVHHSFGKSHQATGFFAHLDVTHDNAITTADFNHHFTQYDTSHDQLITLAEFIEMSKLVPPLIDHRVIRTSEPQSEVALFDAVDLDNSTYLDTDELDALFLLFDTNNDSRITQAEFTVDWVQTYHLGNTAQATTLFKRADVNEDGIISHSDLPHIFAYFDMNGNKQVDLNEFLTQWGRLKLGPTHPIGKVIRTSEPQSEVALFDAVDLDNSTYLDTTELDALFLLFDTNNNSRITKAEFTNDWVQTYHLGNTAQAATLFERADVNADGIISHSDLPHIFAYFDINGNKQVDLNEFLTQWGRLKLGPTHPIGK